MNSKIAAFLICLYVPHALADNHQDSNYRILRSFQKGKIEAVIIVREDGHLLGQPYQVELRANCNKTKTIEGQWPIQDSFSVCDLDPKSLKMNKDQSVMALKTKLSDLTNFNEQIELGISAPSVSCSKNTTIKKFNLSDLCK